MTSAQSMFLKMALRPAAFAASVFVLGAGVPMSSVYAQAYEQRFGDYVLRASTTSALSLPKQMRERHQIPSTGHHAVLNITVQKRSDESLTNARADITVQAQNPLGVDTPVAVEEVVANGFISYFGVYEFLPREVLDFKIVARPAGSSTDIVLEFRDRLGQR